MKFKGKPLELNYKMGDKVKVSPVGQVVGLDGRSYVIDAAELIASISANGLHIPLDENHSFERAAGWFDYTKFEERSDGIYAELEPNELGTECMEKRFYRYLSPVYVMGDNRRVIGLDSVGLVNTPNLLNTAVNKKDEDESMRENELEKELNTTKQTNVELNAKVTELNAKVTTLSEQLKEANQKLKTQQIDARIAAGELLPNAKEFALTLDGDALEKFLDLNKTNTKHLQGRTGVEVNAQEVDEATKAVNAQLGIKE